MKKINEIDVKNKKVILRLDLNVPIENGRVLDDAKIKASVKTIKYLLDENANILIMSHLGKVKTEGDKEKNSLRPVKEILESLLNQEVNFIPYNKGVELENSIKENRITLMENTRFMDVPEKLESGCDLKLAEYWASLGDVFINDAFGTTHRKHASNYGISKFLPSGIGFLIEEEVNGLSPIIKDVKRPFVVVMGGAKVDDKIKLIENMLECADYLLVGGGIANTFLAAIGVDIGSSLVSSDYIEDIKTLIFKYKDKIVMPKDVILDDERTIDVDMLDINTEKICDIGKKTVECYDEIISKAKSLFLNGTMGIYEDPRYANGTIGLFEILKKAECYKIAGGGDALSSINNLGYISAFDFLSTGGGATLEYIINKKMNCFEE